MSKLRNTAPVEPEFRSPFSADPGKSPADESLESTPDSRAYRHNSSQEATSLSMRIMHRPSRAKDELAKACDPTRRNSQINAAMVPDHDPLVSSQSIPGDPDQSPDSAQYKLVRKKSGEIVKPLLKDVATSMSSRSRSLPSTPTYKQVHFGGDTDVRYFKKKDKPTAISASNSPKSHDEEEEEEGSAIPNLEYEHNDLIRTLSRTPQESYFEYYDDELNSHADDEIDPKASLNYSSQPSPSYDWEVEELNFSSPRDTATLIKNDVPLFLENLFLSVDKKYLLGQIAVKNLAFEKTISVRYSLDCWSTIVEIMAIYVPTAPNFFGLNNYDRFMFKIAIDSIANGFSSDTDSTFDSNSEITTELCLKYNVLDQELWDNNNGLNYKFKLCKRDGPSVSESIPSAAKSKPQAHNRKPKYSSSYLKRINSEPLLASDRDKYPFKDSPASTSQVSNSEDKKSGFKFLPKKDDFEHNNYYLSSPLLSNFQNKSTDTAMFKESRLNGDRFGVESRSPSSSPDIRPYGDHQNQKAENETTRSFLPESSHATFPRKSDKPHELMSYKELLDSYCFFNSKSADNSSKTTLVLSDEPTSTSDEVTTSDDYANKPNSIFTVSSFLK